MPIIVEQTEFLKIFFLGIVFGFVARSIFIKKAKVFEIERILKLKDLDVNNKPEKR